MAYVTITQLNDLTKGIENKTLYTKDDVTFNAKNLEVLKDIDLDKYSFVDFINDLTYKAPTITLTHNLSTLVYERGITVRNGITITANVVVGSEEIQQIEFFKDGVSASVITNDVTTGGNFNYADGTDITVDTEYEVVVTTISGKTYKKGLEIKFYNPYYYGVLDKKIDEITSTDVTTLIKDISAKETKKYSFTSNNQYCVIAYPKEYGLLTSILDSNNFENIDSMRYQDIDVNGVPYYIYQTNTVVICTSFMYTFKY